MDRLLGRVGALACALVVMVSCASCGGGGDGGNCTPGQSIGCTCTNGQSGAQTCASDGTFGACECDDDVDSSVGDGSVTDASPIDARPGGREIFVANRADMSIRVFDRTANGGVTPKRMIRGGNTQLAAPVRIAVDAVNGEIFVANAIDDSITVYPIDSDGNVAPIRRIAGAATTIVLDDELFGASGCAQTRGGLFVDPTNNELVVACSGPSGPGCVLTFNRTANGNVAPIRTLAGAMTGLPNLAANGGTRSVHVDTANNELYVLVAPSSPGPTILIFDRTANGNQAPRRSIQTGPGCEADFEVDLPNGEIWTSRSTEFYVYAASATGIATPLRIHPHSENHGAIHLDTPGGEVIGVSANTVTTWNKSDPTSTIRQIAGLTGAADLAVSP